LDVCKSGKVSLTNPDVLKSRKVRLLIRMIEKLIWMFDKAERSGMLIRMFLKAKRSGSLIIMFAITEMSGLLILMFAKAERSGSQI